MALITRISRLFKADFHAVLDQIEEPEQLLRQAIREMEDDLDATEHDLKVCAHEQTALAAQKDEVLAALAELDEELDLCFASRKEDLAKTLVRRKLEARRMLKCLDSKQAANDAYLSGQQAGLDENRATLEGLRQKAEIFAQRAPQFGSEAEFADLSLLKRDLKVNDDEVEVAFLREKSKRSAS